MTRATLSVGGQGPGEHLERHLAPEMRVPRAVDATAAAAAEQAEDLETADARSGRLVRLRS